MYSVAPYLVRCRDTAIADKDHRHLLENIRGRDVFTILQDFIKARLELKKVDDSSKVYKFAEVQIDEQKREITAFVLAGAFGVRGDIVDVKDGSKVHDKKTSHADLNTYYFHAYFPKGCQEAILLLGVFKGDGIKTFFHHEFGKFFTANVNLPLSLNPLPHKKAISSWQEAVTKEFRVIGFKTAMDVSDVERFGGNLQRTLTITPPSKRSHFGRFMDLFDKSKDQYSFVEELRGAGAEVKAVVKLGKKTRVFKVGVVNDNAVCQIDLDDDVEMKDGVPLIRSVRKWASELMADISNQVYGKYSQYKPIQEKERELQN
ncbi:hypothetical protein BUE93_08605 [Chromobacterium amazonense]|uniref:Uncharacterized protein n=1 Tax=Chromobacterium amazonense TaxID=1382803 RepID=A0A2S9X5Q0_9NEIS|nr:hypothetical protein [Chromobacterium amazonense]PRP71006.1 hypothetical protein BUE93_08605 [Chromobacterium amazonense]